MSQFCKLRSKGRKDVAAAWAAREIERLRAELETEIARNRALRALVSSIERINMGFCQKIKELKEAGNTLESEREVTAILSAENASLKEEVRRTKEDEFPVKVQAVAEGWRKKTERLEAENAELKSDLAAMTECAKSHDAGRTKYLLENAELRAASPDDIRRDGWAVAVHNDYKLNGVPHTFWLFTKGNSCVKGEGLTDSAALDEVRKTLKEQA